MYQFLLISITNELYYWDTAGGLRVVSTLTSIIWLLVCFACIFIAATLVLSKYKIDENKHNKLEEFFSGFKLEKKFQVYSVFLLLRVTVFVIGLITLSSLSSRGVTGIMGLLQVVFCIYSAILRPMMEAKANAIVIINEIFFIFILGSLAFLNEESDWSTTTTMIYVWMLGSNTIVIFIIVLSKPGLNIL